MTLSKEQYEIIDKIATKTKCNCWFSIRQDDNDNDYVFDLEENKKISLLAGLSLLWDSVCDELIDHNEVLIMEELLNTLYIEDKSDKIHKAYDIAVSILNGEKDDSYITDIVGYLGEVLDN